MKKIFASLVTAVILTVGVNVALSCQSHTLPPQLTMTIDTVANFETFPPVSDAPISPSDAGASDEVM